MGSGRIFAIVVAGMLGAALSWALSEPFVYTAARDGIRTETVHFTLGSFYGWYGHLLLGALIAGPIAFAISLGRTRFRTALMSGLGAAVIGGALTCGLDALSDWSMIQAIRGGGGAPAFVLHPIWNVAIGIGLAMAVALASQPTPARLWRGFLVGVGAGIASFMAGQVVGTVVATVQFIQGGNLQSWQPWDPTRLIEREVLGLCVGLAMGLGTYAFRRGWLRHELARGEYRDYPLENGPNRIGSAEGIEVPLRGVPGVEPLHAQIDFASGQWYVTAVNSLPMGVNGYPASQAWLNDGDSIQIGGAMLRLSTRVPPRPGVPFAPPVPTVPVASATPVVPMSMPPTSPRFIAAGGRVIPLPEGINTVGRDPASTFCLAHDPRASRRHAEIEVAAGHAVLRDLGSSNGTTVNGVPISGPRELVSGDEVSFAQTRVVYRA